MCVCLQYRFYGEPVVKACVENGAHHIDISGEPQVLKYSTDTIRPFTVHLLYNTHGNQLFLVILICPINCKIISSVAIISETLYHLTDVYIIDTIVYLLV